MIPDLRVSSELPDHWKTKRLVRQCGDGAFRCLVRLWSWASKHRPDGDLSGMDDEAIADASGWDGDASRWSSALVLCQWVDSSEAGLTLHDWAEHQPWVITAPERTEKAKKNAHLRHHKNNKKPASCSYCIDATSSATSNARSIQKDASGNATAMLHPCPSAPSPSPDTSTIQNQNISSDPDGSTTHSGNGRVRPSKAKPEADHEFMGVFEKIWNLYPRHDGKEKSLKLVWSVFQKGGEPELQLLANATGHYARARCGEDPTFTMIGPTFYGGRWRDWINGDPKPKFNPNRNPKL